MSNVIWSSSFPVGLMLCHQQLALPELFELWRQALHGSYITTLCRDEVLHTHLFIINYFESIKGLVDSSLMWTSLFMSFIWMFLSTIYMGILFLLDIYYSIWVFSLEACASLNSVDVVLTPHWFVFSEVDMFSSWYCLERKTGTNPFIGKLIIYASLMNMNTGIFFFLYLAFPVWIATWSSLLHQKRFIFRGVFWKMIRKWTLFNKNKKKLALQNKQKFFAYRLHLFKKWFLKNPIWIWP